MKQSDTSKPPLTAEAHRAKRRRSRILLRRIWGYTARRKGLLAALILTCALYTLLSLSLPFLVGRAIDTMLGAQGVDFSHLSPLLTILLLISAFIALSQWGMTEINNRLSYETVRDLRGEAFRKIDRLPLSYLDHHPTGDLVSRIIADTDHFAEGLLGGISHLIGGALTLIGTLIFLLILHPVTALLILLLTPTSLLLTHLITRYSYGIFKEQSRVRGEQTAFIEEMIAGQKLIHSFTAEERVLSEFDALNDALLHTSRRSRFLSSLGHVASHFVHHMVLAVICFTGPLAVIEGTITVGSLVGLIFYAEQFAKPFHELNAILAELQGAFASASRIFELLDQPDLPSDEGLARLPDPQGHIVLSHVSYAYEDESQGHEAIHDITLDIAPGEQIAVVGRTGCGKTTLVHLLMGFYRPTAGSISIDGYDITAVTHKSLYQGLGLVLQDTWLRHGTIRENLAFGRPDASEEVIRAAAVHCMAHDFIERMPRGYDTVISEGGKELSAGQRQLLCIARALVTDPEILILDEATSSLDSHTETMVQAAISSLAHGRTCIIAAHRLSTVLAADRILVMEEGRIAESGTHSELLARNGIYAAMYRSQFQH